MRRCLVSVLMLWSHQSSTLECVAIANGSPLPASIVHKVTRERKVVALDGAVRALRDIYDSTVRPDIVMGDFDSCSFLDRQYFESATVIHAPSQELSDLEKGILQCDTLGASDIWLLNALGLDRLDHTIAAMYILKKHHKAERRIRLVSLRQILEFVKDGPLSFEAAPGEAVGVFGLSQAHVTSRGLQYEMADYFVEGPHFSSSNYAVGPRVFLEIRGEALVSYPHNMHE